MALCAGQMWRALEGGFLFSSIARCGVAVAAAMTIGGLTIAAIDAEAAPSHGCVTKTEFRKVHRGDALERVARIFDTAGLRVSIAAYGGHKSQIRDYRTCKPNSAVHVSFDKGPGARFHLSDKSAVWVV